MDRSIARAHAMQLIYENEMGGEGGEETRLNLLCVEPGEDESDFMNAMYEGVMAHSEEIDARIAEYLRGWTIERLAKVDLAILRLGAYEILYTDTPAAVIVNEAVELAKQYSSERSGSFVNGVLGNLSREES